MKVVFHFDGSAALLDREILCPESDAAAFEKLLPEMEVLWHVLKPVTADVIAGYLQTGRWPEVAAHFTVERFGGPA